MPNNIVKYEPIWNDDLFSYVGEWVALRDGEVVAHGDEPEKLLDILPSDIILFVPDSTTSAVFL